MSIARLTSLAAIPVLASCNLNHPALQPPPYQEAASVEHNGTSYLVEELENPTPEYVVTAPPPTVDLPSVPPKPEPAPPAAVAPPQPSIAKTKPAAPEAAPAPERLTVTDPTPPTKPAPEIAVTSTPEPPAAAPEKPVEPAVEPAPAEPVVAAVEAEPEVEIEADTLRAEEFAIEFAKTLPFPSGAEISTFPQVLSPDTLTLTEPERDMGKTSVLLEKVRKKLARATAVKRAPTPWANQPGTAARMPEPKPVKEAEGSFDPAIESLSIIPGAPHDERLDFGLDLGPTSKFDFGDSPE